jgi:tRNA(Arg) A34 adenosine deaminase TadA
MKKNSGPFGCVIVKDGKVIARAHNTVTLTNDPTAHAEVMAIRKACKKLGTYQLTGCELYSSCEPCPMCLGAIYWSRPDKVYFACTRKDAAAAGFDDDVIYQELSLDIAFRKIPFEALLREEALHTFGEWDLKENKIKY